MKNDNTDMKRLKTNPSSAIAFWAVGITLLVGLYLTSLYNYLLFHSLVEIFSITVAVAIFMVAWNSRKFMDNDALLFLGVAYLFTGLIDLIHTLSYQGMSIFSGYDTNLPTQLWIAARYMQSISLLVFPLLLKRKLQPHVLCLFYAVVTGFILTSILYWDIFPVCFIMETGLTPFKSFSECVIAAILIASIILLYQHRREFEEHVLRLLIMSIFLAVAAELAFIYYINVNDFPNLAGHFLKLISFYLIYRALIQLNLGSPYDTLFRDLKRSKDELRDKEEKLRCIIEHSNEMFYLHDPKHHVTYVSPQCQEIFGYTSEEMMLNWAVEPTDNSINQTGKELTAKAIESGKKQDAYHLELIGKDGIIKIVRIDESPILDDQGNVIAISGACRDVTEQRRANEKLDASERKYRTLLENLPQRIFLKDVNSVFVSCNEAFARDHNIATDDVVGKTDYDFYLGELADKYREDDQRIMDSGVAQEIEETHVLQEQESTINIVKTPVSDDSGNVTGILGIFWDITERKQSEEVLREKEEMLRSIIEHSNEMFYIHNTEHVLSYASPQCEEIFGYTSEEMKVKWISLATDNPMNQAGFELTEKAIKTGKRQEPYHLELLGKDGKARLVRIDESPILDEQGKVIGISGACRDVTERLRTKEALREGEERYSALFSGITDAIYVHRTTSDGLPGRIIEVNDIACQMLGYTKEELLGMEISEIDTTDSSIDLRAVLEELKAGRPVLFEQSHKTKDGRRIPVEIHAQKIQYEGQIAILSTARDITERKREEEEKESLRRLAQRLTAPLSMKEVGRIVAEESRRLFNHDFFYLDSYRHNDNICHGVYTEDTPRGSSKPVEMTPTNSTMNTPNMLRVTSGEPVLINRESEPEKSEFTLAGDTTRLSLSLMFVPIRWANQVIGVLSVQSYTQSRYGEKYLKSLEAFATQCGGALMRVSAEEERESLRRLAQRLTEVRNQKDVGRTVAEESRRLFDHDCFHLSYCLHNENICRGLYTEDTYSGNSSPTETPSTDSSMDSPSMRVVASGKPILLNRTAEPEESEFTPVGDTTRRSLSLMFVPVCWANQVIGVISVQSYSPSRYGEKDLQSLEAFTTQCGGALMRVSAEEERSKLEAQVQQAQKLESLGVLAGGIAHDFNNLLMGILGNADLALLDISRVHPAHNNLLEVKNAAHRSADLARQMLAYSGKGRFVIEAINLNEVVREMGHLLESSISKSSLLKYDLSNDLPSIEADVTQIRQVVMNLITNASEALGEETGVIRITTGVMHCDRTFLRQTYLDEQQPEGEYTYLEVTDSGCGMDKETAARIFDPFYTTKFTGRGLGLAALLGIVRGHRGAIKVDSQPGKGTTFMIAFPALDKPAETLREDIGEETQWSGSGTVLLVDDEEMVLSVGKKMLEIIGFSVLTAEDGREAVELFRQRPDEIKCVVLDLSMPHMGGEEAFGELRKIREDIRVVLSSGYTEQEIEERFMGEGLAGFIKKPYMLSNLQSIMKQVMES
jgi:PAS domain S-box-containing protein